MLLAGVLALIACATSVASPAQAGASATTPVEIQARDDWFLPFVASVPRGGSVVWTFTGAERSHTATDSSGMALFDSGIVEPGGPSFSYRFLAAGRYPYTCTVHPVEMNGYVEVPVRVWPENGRVGRSFRVRWAVGTAPEGQRYDVQIEPPGGTWTSWMEAVTASSATFEPDLEGRFRFRARLRETEGAATGWSRRVTLTVT